LHRLWSQEATRHSITRFLPLLGLGKTLQTISLLAYLREDRKMHGPHLVIVPKTTVGNWLKEFAKWCPAIKVRPKREGLSASQRRRATFLTPCHAAGDGTSTAIMLIDDMTALDAKDMLVLYTYNCRVWHVFFLSL
jgi:hypothetical protein